MSNQTAQQWLLTRAPLLKNRGIESARLDCLLLLEKVLQIDRSHILAHLDEPLGDLQARALEVFFARRYRHEPMAYILGQVEFYGRTFVVNKHVLVPRPESEDIIKLAKSLPRPERILDIGTGSGALAITLQRELSLPVTGLDIDPECLDVARRNASALRAEVTWLQSDLLAQMTAGEKSLGFVANLPYVPDEYEINHAAKYEPALALFSGADGLDHYRRLFAQLPSTTNWLITEALESQHDALVALAVDHHYKLSETRGLAQVFVPNL